MHGLLVVPHDDIPNLPFVPIDITALRRMVDKLAEKPTSFVLGKLDDVGRVAGEV